MISPAPSNFKHEMNLSVQFYQKMILKKANEMITQTQNFNQSDKIIDLDTGSGRDTNGWSGC